MTTSGVMNQRAKRQIKAPAKFEDIEYGVPKQRPEAGDETATRKVYRVLKRRDLTRKLKEKDVYLYWPDDGQWYPVKFLKLKRKEMKALVKYVGTEDSEEAEHYEDVDLTEVLANREISVLECRNPDAKLRRDEIPVQRDGTEVYFSPESDEESLDAGAIEDSDDDVSDFSSIDEEDHNIDLDAHDVVDFMPSGESRKSQGLKRKLSANAETGTPAKSFKTAAFYGSDQQGSKGRSLFKNGSTGSSASAAAAGSMPKTPMAALHKTGSVTAQAAKPAIPPDDVRKNARAKFAECLVRAAKELREKGANEQELLDATQTAQAIETECSKKYAPRGDISKEYRLKFRSLYFNLTDEKNPELRHRVILGELKPEKLVTMSADELASKEVSQWRLNQVEKSMKMSILDPEAAAMFSTAANRSLAKQELEEKLKKEAIVHEVATVRPDAAQLLNDAIHQPDLVVRHHLAARVLKSAAEAAAADEGGDPGSDADDRADDDFMDYDSYVARSQSQLPAMDVTTDSPEYKDDDDDGEGGHPPARGDDDKAGVDAPADVEEEHTMARQPSTGGFKPHSAATPRPSSRSLPPEYNPASDIRPPPGEDRDRTPPLSPVRTHQPKQHRSPHSAPKSPKPQLSRRTSSLDVDDGSSQFKDVEDLAPLILPAWDSLPGHGAPGVKLWSGWLSMPGTGNWKADVASLQGVGDLQRMLRESTITVKGKLPTPSLLKFFDDLKGSRSRTVTVGVMRVSSSLAADELDAFNEFVDGMKQEGKCTAVGPGGYEGYIIPSGELSARLCATAHVAAPDRFKRSVKPNIGDGELMLALVHSRKDKDKKLASEFAAQLKRNAARNAKLARLAAKQEAQPKQHARRSTEVKPAHPSGADPPPIASAPAPAPIITPSDPRSRPQSESTQQQTSQPAAQAPATTAEQPSPTPAPLPLDISALAASVLGSVSASAPAPQPAAPANPQPAAPSTPLGFDLGSSLTSLAAVLGNLQPAPTQAAPSQPPVVLQQQPPLSGGPPQLHTSLPLPQQPLPSLPASAPVFSAPLSLPLQPLAAPQQPPMSLPAHAMPGAHIIHGSLPQQPMLQPMPQQHQPGPTIILRAPDAAGPPASMPVFSAAMFQPPLQNVPPQQPLQQQIAQPQFGPARPEALPAAMQPPPDIAQRHAPGNLQARPASFQAHNYPPPPLQVHQASPAAFAARPQGPSGPPHAAPGPTGFPPDPQLQGLPHSHAAPRPFGGGRPPAQLPSGAGMVPPPPPPEPASGPGRGPPPPPPPLEHRAWNEQYAGRGDRRDHGRGRPDWRR